MSLVTVITDAEFGEKVLQSELPALVYFWASWCGPCRLMTPLMDGVAETYAERLRVFKMEVDPNPQSVAKCSVEGVPALRLFKQGEIHNSSEGAMSQKKLAEFLVASLEGAS